MIPSKTDPRWRAALTSSKDVPLKNLATKLLVVRAKLMMRNAQNPAMAQEAIDTAYNYFAKNEAASRDDLTALLG